MGFDLAVFDQAAWLISHGQQPFVTVRGMHILADHFSLIIYLVAPLYRLWADPRTLICVQCTVLMFGAYPVYAFMRFRNVHPTISLFAACCYLLYPPVQHLALNEFHPDAIATTALLFAFLNLERRRLSPMVASLIVACCCKEPVSLTCCFFGVYALTVDKTFGIAAIGVGLLGTLTAFTVMSHFSHGATTGYIALYKQYGNSPAHVISHLLKHPAIVAKALSAPGMQKFIFQLLAPGMFCSLIAPDVLIGAIPALLVNALGSRAQLRMLPGHHTAFLTPFVVHGTLIGALRLKQFARFNATIVLCTSIGACTLLSTAWSPYPVFAGERFRNQSDSAAAETRRLLATIPADSAVAADASILAFLSRRPYVYAFPNPFCKSWYGPGVAAQLQVESGDFCCDQPHLKATAPAGSRVKYIALCRDASAATPSYRQYVADVLTDGSFGIVSVGRHVLILRRYADIASGTAMLARYIGQPQITAVKDAYDLWLAAQFPEM